MQIIRFFLIIILLILTKTINNQDTINWTSYIIGKNQLKANNLKIESLSGIEKMRDLQKLDLSSNLIVDIDILQNLTRFRAVLQLNIFGEILPRDFAP